MPSTWASASPGQLPLAIESRIFRRLIPVPQGVALRQVVEPCVMAVHVLFFCIKPKKEVRMILHYELANYIQILIFSLAVIGIIAAIFYAGHSHKG